MKTTTIVMINGACYSYRSVYPWLPVGRSGVRAFLLKTNLGVLAYTIYLCPDHIIGRVNGVLLLLSEKRCSSVLLVLESTLLAASIIACKP